MNPTKTTTIVEIENTGMVNMVGTTMAETAKEEEEEDLNNIFLH